MLEIFSIVCYTVLDISTRRKPVERIKRNERMAALTKLLTASPNRIFTLSYFCEMFGAAKSTLSEDIDLLRGVFDTFGLGKLDTVTGAAGGVRYRPVMKSPRTRGRSWASCARSCAPPRACCPAAFSIWAIF